MLTDIFGIRYEDVPIFQSYSKREKRVLHQSVTVLEEAFPYWETSGPKQNEAKGFWDEVHKRVANELGVKHLSTSHYPSPHGSRPLIEVTRDYVLRPFDVGDHADTYIKNRLSVVEVGMRIMFKQASSSQDQMNETGGGVQNLLKKFYLERIERHKTAEEELNVRFGQGRFPLHYHNGFIQLKKDEKISSQIEQPFWSLVFEPMWKNVDFEMKEALDQLDTGGKHPAFHAGKAFESALKIISSQMNLTHGSERGAHSFVDNLAKSGVDFLKRWEAEEIKHYFTKVRNPLGHGPGEEPMHLLDYEQSSWAIEGAMSWIKLLVTRFNAMKDPTP